MLRSAAEVLFHPSKPSSTGVSNNSPHAPNQQTNTRRNLRWIVSYLVWKNRQILLNFGMLFRTPPEYRLIPTNHLNGALSGHPVGDGKDQS
jgi:hypothetical protein